MDDDQDYDLRRADRRWLEQDEKQRIEAQKNAEWENNFQFERFWDAVKQAFGLGYYAPATQEKMRNRKRRTPAAHREVIDQGSR